MSKVFLSVFTLINLFFMFDSNAALVNIFRLNNGESAQIRVFGDERKIIQSWEGDNEFIKIDTDKYYDEIEGYELFIKENLDQEYHYVGPIYFHEKLPNGVLLITPQPGNVLQASSNAVIVNERLNEHRITYRAAHQQNQWHFLQNSLQFDQNIIRIEVNGQILTENIFYYYSAGQRIPGLEDVQAGFGPNENAMGYNDARLYDSIEEIRRLTQETPEDLELMNVYGGRDPYQEMLRIWAINELNLKINELQPLVAQFERASTQGLAWANELENARRALDGLPYPGTEIDSHPNFRVNEMRNVNGIDIGCCDLLVKVMQLIYNYPFPDQTPEQCVEIRHNMMRVLIVNLGQCIEDDGHRICTKGKMKRLITALQGYIPNVTLDAIDNNDVPVVKDVFAAFYADTNNSFQHSDFLMNLFVMQDYEYFIENSDHYNAFQCEYEEFLKNKRKELKRVAREQFAVYPVEKFQLRELLEDRIHNVWDDLVKEVARDFNEKHAGKDLPVDFNPFIYINLHKDLFDYAADKKMDENQKIEFAKWHYVNHGREKNRIYALPVDFNPLVYLEQYNDLSGYADSQRMNENQKIEFAKNHYLNHGRRAGRPYRI